MKPKFLFLATLVMLALSACQKKDINALRSEINDLKNRVTRLEDAAKMLNTDIASLIDIATSLQAKISVVSYTATANGYELTMSDGSKITLSNGKDGTNGKDGINAPLIGLQQDTDGNYYWTIGGDWLLQNGQKVKANGTDGASGINGITPLLMVNATSNQWMVSYDNGNSWSVIKDGNGNPITATGPQGPSGTPGATGPQGPAGIPGFSISENETALFITYNGITYTLLKSNSTNEPDTFFIVFETQNDPNNETITLRVDADLADRADIWIDLNNNKEKEPGEKVTSFGTAITYNLIGSQTITLYGKVKYFSCTYENISNLDISRNTYLTTLRCFGNTLSSLDLSKNTALTTLYCEFNNLSSLDLSKNTALTTLTCYNNKLNSLDLSKNIALTTLNCSNNLLNTIDVSKNTALTALTCTNNFLNTLDVSKNTALTTLRCYENQIIGDPMKQLINSLLNSNVEKEAYIKNGNDGNTVPNPEELNAAKAKNWKLYDFNHNDPILLNP